MATQHNVQFLPFMKVLNDLDNKLKSLGLFFDLPRAFGSINHILLLCNISCYEIRDTALTWVWVVLLNKRDTICSNQI